MSVFLEISEDKILHKDQHFFIIEDAYPVSPGHLLIISNLERRDYFELSDDERNALQNTILKAKEIVESKHQPDGYNIGMNSGRAAGQTVFHFHCHVIPRYEGDMDDPRGGIRHCVKNKGYYDRETE